MRQPTSKQMSYIYQIERLTGWSFQGDTLQDASDFIEEFTEWKTVEQRKKKQTKQTKLNLKKIYIGNDYKTTVVLWSDNTKTIVKRSKGTIFDIHIAFLTAYFQKTSGLSKTQANKFLSNLKGEQV